MRDLSSTERQSVAAGFEIFPYVSGFAGAFASGFVNYSTFNTLEGKNDYSVDTALYRGTGNAMGYVANTVVIQTMNAIAAQLEEKEL